MPSATMTTTASRAAPTPVSAPLRPNAKVPVRSSARNSGDSVVTRRVYHAVGIAAVDVAVSVAVVRHRVAEPVPETTLDYGYDHPPVTRACAASRPVGQRGCARAVDSSHTRDCTTTICWDAREHG